MGVISVRLDDRDQAWLERHGLKPGTFAREAVAAAIRRAEVKEAMDELARNAIRLDRPFDEVWAEHKAELEARPKVRRSPSSPADTSPARHTTRQGARKGK